MRKLLIGALLLLIPLGLMGQDNYRYQCAEVVGVGASEGIRAQDMNSHSYFRGYWSFLNLSSATTVRTRVAAYYLNGSTGAPRDSLVFYLPRLAAVSGIVCADSVYVTQPTGSSDSVSVFCHGDRAVGVYGP